MNDIYLEFAKELAEDAGKIMKKYFMAEEIGLEIKADQTPLTLADTEVNSLVIKRVKERFPEHGVLGEEESFNLDKSKLWIVDPLDGTPFFARKVPTFAFSIAYVEAGDPKVALVYDPNTQRSSWAIKGQGAYENDKKLDMANQALNKNLVISSWVTGEGNQSSISNREIDGKLSYSYGKAGNILEFDMPIAYVLPLVASGDFDACVTSVKNPWDVAAGALIAMEAGCKVTDLFGHDISSWDKDVKGLVAAPPEIYEYIFGFINPIMKDFE